MLDTANGGTHTAGNAAAETPRVSVVVIGRNEGERLTRCLESVARMRPPGGPVETIYVDSASSDDSVRRAAELGARVIAVHPAHPSAALGRNAGWRSARAPIVLFLDGDTVLDPDFVERSLGDLEDPKVAVVWGHRRERHPDASIFNRVLDLDWIYPAGVSEFCGGDALVRRAALEEVGGYDERLIAGEEPELCCRIRARGYLILHVDRPMTGHDLAITRWSQYWRRAVRAGHAFAQVATERSHDATMPLWEGYARVNLIHGALLVVLLGGAVAASLALRSPLPLAAAIAGLVLLVARTAVRARWKSPSKTTLLLYAVHSHLQQVPILCGQLAYHAGRLFGRRPRLIEYKEAR
jgi:hypothetical protein